MGWTKEKADKWKNYDPYASSKPNGNSGWTAEKAAKWKNYDPYASSVSAGDSWGALAVKAPLRGIGDLFDIPQAIGSGLEGIKNNTPTNLPAGRGMAYAPLPANLDESQTLQYRQSLKDNYGINHPAVSEYLYPEQTDYSSYIPSATGAYKKLKKYTGIDLEPHPVGYEQEIFSNAAKFAGGLPAGGILGNFAKAGSGLQKFLGTAKGASEIGKKAALGAAIGGTSGLLQQEDIADPLTADIISSIGVPGAGALLGKAGASTKNLLGTFTKAGRQKQLENEVGDILRTNIREKHIPNVIARLDTEMPYGINPITAEVANNPGLSKLHQALEANNMEVLEKQALNDEIIKNRLNDLSPIRGTDSLQNGEDLINAIQKQYTNLYSDRGESSKNLYDIVRSMKNKIGTPNLITHIDKKLETAIDTDEKLLNKIKKLITPENPEPFFVGGEEVLPTEMLDMINKIQDPATKAKLMGEFTDKQGVMVAKLGELEQWLNDKINVAYKKGANNQARKLLEIKTELLKDLEVVPEQTIARENYRQRSPEINAIESQPFLQRFLPDVSRVELVEPQNIEKMLGMKTVPISKIAPEQVGKQLFSKKTHVRDIKALMRQIKNDPVTIDTLRAEVVNQLFEKIELGSSNALGKQNISYDKLTKFLKENKYKLRLIFEPAQIEVLENVREIMKRRNIASSMGVVPNKSVTQSETTLLAGLANSGMNKLIDLIPWVSSLYHKGSKLYKDAHNQAIQELLKEAMSDPQKAKMLLTKTKDVINADRMQDLLQQISQTTPTIASNYLNNGGE